MKQPVRRERNPGDYGYPTPDVEALSAKALEVTQRLTRLYGELPFSSKDPMSMLVEIILSHRTRDEQTDVQNALTKVTKGSILQMDRIFVLHGDDAGWGKQHAQLNC